MSDTLVTGLSQTERNVAGKGGGRTVRAKAEVEVAVGGEEVRGAGLTMTNTNKGHRGKVRQVNLLLLVSAVFVSVFVFVIVSTLVSLFLSVFVSVSQRQVNLKSGFSAYKGIGLPTYLL